MKWFDKWFRKMSKKVWESSRDQLVESVSGSSYSGLRGGQPMSFTIYKANGGFVIQYFSEDYNANNHYSSSPSKHEPKLLIVHQGEDLGKAIDQLILVEALKA